MKAVVYREYGSPEKFQVLEIPKPIPKENEVLIKVHSASINSWDMDLLKGDPLSRLIFLGILKPRHTILGCDIAGRIDAVGENVTQFKVGDEVYGDISGDGWGGFAEFVCAAENLITWKPNNLSFEETASLPQAGVLALQGLKYNGEIKQGQKILINGAGGGVGTIALQIAKLFEAEVTCVDKANKLDFLISLGANYVINFEQEDFTRNGHSYDLILDNVANKSVFDYKRSLTLGGACVIVGGSFKSILQAITLGSPISTTNNKKVCILAHRPNQKDLNILREYFEEERIKPVVDKIFPLSNTADAFRYFEKGDFKGKVVISMN